MAGRYGINQTTVAKWEKRLTVSDAPTGPKNPRSTNLTIEEEAIVVAFRKHALLPLDDGLYALQATPKLKPRRDTRTWLRITRLLLRIKYRKVWRTHSDRGDWNREVGDIQSHK